MNFIQAELSCAAGVVLSVVVPVLARSVKQEFQTTRTMRMVGPPSRPSWTVELLKILGKAIAAVWPRIRPYLTLIAFSAVVGILIIAFMGDKLDSWQKAFITGYLWDSTLQKIVGKP